MEDDNWQEIDQAESDGHLIRWWAWAHNPEHLGSFYGVYLLFFSSSEGKQLRTEPSILVWWDELHLDTWIKRNSKRIYIHTFTQTCVYVLKRTVIFINFINYTQIPYFAIDITKKKRKESPSFYCYFFFLVVCNHS